MTLPSSTTPMSSSLPHDVWLSLHPDGGDAFASEADGMAHKHLAWLPCDPPAAVGNEPTDAAGAVADVGSPNELQSHDHFRSRCGSSASNVSGASSGSGDGYLDVDTEANRIKAVLHL